VFSSHQVLLVYGLVVELNVIIFLKCTGLSKDDFVFGFTNLTVINRFPVTSKGPTK